MAVDWREFIMVLTNLAGLAQPQYACAACWSSSRLPHASTCWPQCTSVYRWEGQVETATEVPMLIKTSRAAYSRVEEEILANHPYELPEIVSVPVVAGLGEYLSWVAAESTAE